MRLPWPFGRTQRSADADAGRSSGARVVPAERPSGDAWRRLPPLAESVGPPPLVAPNRPFAAGLAAGEPPAPILAPLAHGRSLEAPRGLVAGIARPTTAEPGPPLPAPVQRSPIGAGRQAVSRTNASWPDMGSGAPITDSDPQPAPGRRASVAAVAPAEIRRLPVADVAPIRSTGPLTVAPAHFGRPAVGLVAQPRTRGSADDRRSGTASSGSAPVQRSPIEAVPGGLPPAPAPPDRPSTAHQPRLTIGQARRLGLGAPVAGGPIPPAEPATGRVERAPTSTEMPLVGSVPASQPADRSDAVTAPGRIPEARLTPSRASSSEPPVIARPLPTSRRAEGQATVVRGAAPNLAAAPLRAGVQRAPLTLPQRAPEGAASPASLPAPASAAPGGPVTVHRGNEATALSKSLDARSFTHGGEIFLPASHGPLTSGKGKALLAHELTHVAQQRRLGSGLPAEHTSHGRSLEAEAVAAERSSDMTLALPRERAAPSTNGVAPAATSAGPDPGGTRPQRAPEGTGGMTLELGEGKLLDEPAAGGTTLELGEGKLLSGGEPARRGGTRREARTEQELEVLAHQLYHRIGRHLRRELLVDRERVGFALDLP